MKNFYLLLAMLAMLGALVEFTPASLNIKSLPQRQSTEIPKIRSMVPGVTLERVRVVDDTDVEFDIVNNTSKSIISVTLRSGNYSQTYNAYGNDGVFIFPGYKSEEGRFSLRDIQKGKGITLTAVAFENDELEGTDFDKEQFIRRKAEKAEGKAPAPLPSQFKRAHKEGGVKQ